MYYQITHPPAADDAKQADELGRLLKHSTTLTVQFVTVAGSYKPTRARLTLLTVPDRVADQAARVLALLADVEEAVKPSAVLRQRPEWTQQRVLLPTAPDAPPLDGTLLDGWDSACLTVAYRPGQALARLAYCADDTARVDRLQIDGWQVTRPNPFQKLALGSGRPWTGVPSFTPVPGGVTPARAPHPPVDHATPAMPDAPAPIQEELRQALTDASEGFLLGVTPEGSPVRLARRAMTVAVNGPLDARQRAVLALLRRGMQAGMGLLVMVDRALLPNEALHVWEARARLLDVQNIADSSAIPWRDSAPDLLAQAIGGPAAALPALPSRFGAVLDLLGAESLRVPAVLGLVTMPGDDLRGVLAAGGMMVVPQDGDAASQVVARILMAYLATPPAIGRGLLVVSDPALVLPHALRQQAIQVVVGARSDALLRLSATDAGWTVAAPDGSPVADLLPDLMAQPTEGAGDLVESIVREIGVEDALETAAAQDAPADALDGWWAGGERNDDLEHDDDSADAEPSVGVPMVEIADAPVEVVTDEFPAAAVVADVSDAMDVEATIAPAPALIDEEPASDLDRALGSLLTMLMADEPADATEAAIQAAVAGEDFGAADAAALAWAAEAPQRARPWLWRVVLAEEDTTRAVAAWRAIQHEPEGAYAAQVRAVLDTMGASEPAAWLAGIGDDTPVVPRDEDAQDAADLPDLADWPTVLDEAAAQDDTGGEHAAPVRVGERAEPAVAAEPAAAVPLAAIAPTVQEADTLAPASAVAPLPPSPALVNAAADLSDDAIRAIWQAGESVPQLVARLVASGVAAPAARARVRAIVSARPPMASAAVTAPPAPPMRAIALSSTCVPAPPIPVEPDLSPAIPTITLAPLLSELQAPAAMIPAISADSMNGSSTPHMDAEGMDDERIWQRWQDGMKTDDLALAICGKRGGPKADAARERLYGVVIPRMVTALDCDDLLDRLAAGEPVASDPRYPDLMKRLARSEHAPAGNLERALLKRLARARQEV